jgi:hypothetical protein
MTAVQHRLYAGRCRANAEVIDVQIQLAAERDDTVTVYRLRDERQALLELADHHEEQAMAKALAPLP